MLVAVFVCSLAVKLIGVAYMNRYLSWNLVAPDTRGQYQPLAVNLLEGRGYQLTGKFHETTAIAPGFPVYLAAIYSVFGFQTPVWWLGALNAVMRSVVTCLVYLLAASGFGERTAWIAAGVHAMDPWEAFWAAFVLKESLAVLLSVTAVYAIAMMVSAPTWRRGIAAGLVIALASLTRYATLGLFLWSIVLLAVFGRRRMLARNDAMRLAVALTIGVIIGLSPWLIRNGRLFGTPVVYTQAGYYFYVSNGPGVERAPEIWGYSGRSSLDTARMVDISRNHRELAARETVFFKEAVVYLVSHPLAMPTLIAARLVNMWRPTFEGASTANILVLGAPYCVAMMAAIVGLVLGCRYPQDGDERTQLVLYWAVAFYVLLHAFFWSEIRYRQYATPFLAVFAGCTLSTIRRHLAYRQELT